MIGKIGYLGLLVPLITFSTITSAQSSSAHIAPAGSQKAIFGAEENFTGRVRVAPLFTADKDMAVSAAYVTFEPGARSAWHTHPRRTAAYRHFRRWLDSGGRSASADNSTRRCGVVPRRG